MAYVTPRANGTWEVRESHLTAAGPRSRTLVTFKTLTPAVLERAQARASRPLKESELRQAARRAGAPVEPSSSDRASAELIAELDAGRKPRPALTRLLLNALRVEDDQSSEEQPPLHRAEEHNARAAAAWITATPQQRGHTLRDLLLLVDHLPQGRVRERERFPRIQSHPV